MSGLQLRMSKSFSRMSFCGEGQVDGISYNCVKDGLVYIVEFHKGSISGTLQIPSHLAESARNPVDLIRNKLFHGTYDQSEINARDFFPPASTYFV